MCGCGQRSLLSQRDKPRAANIPEERSFSESREGRARADPAQNVQHFAKMPSAKLEGRVAVRRDCHRVGQQGPQKRQ